MVLKFYSTFGNSDYSASAVVSCCYAAECLKNIAYYDREEVLIGSEIRVVRLNVEFVLIVLFPSIKKILLSSLKFAASRIQLTYNRDTKLKTCLTY